MTSLLVLLALGAQPVKVFVSADGVNSDRVSSAVCVQSLAEGLRAWGVAVTTDGDLAAMAAGKRQEQLLGCDDRDCGIDNQILVTGEARLECLLSGDDELLVVVRVIDMKPADVTRLSLGAPMVTTSKGDLGPDVRGLAPQVAGLLRARFGVDRVAERPLYEPAGTRGPRRCSVAGEGAAALLGACVALRASASRRSSARAEPRPRPPA
ncbi:MAG: hypothetical protein JNK82_10390 [Myxococcaceae bacterium]|nr:hypothetical protein [Myxococcaceae bacterium]